MLTVVEDARVRAADGHAAWSESFNELFARVAGCFANAAVRRHGRAYVLGLLSQTERKNSWWLAEFAGDASPDGLQRLLNFSPWDEDACRDALCRYVVRELGDPGAVLAADETGFLKKGRMSAGVARQYTGTAGRVENCQVGVFLAYCAPDGSRALIDRELYIPKKWAQDRDRCKAAGIGDEVSFATKPQLAKTMIGRAVNAGVPFKWVTGDEVYGGSPELREWLEAEKIPYVLAVACSAMIPVAAQRAMRADELAALVPAGAWQQASCADGSKGPRLYDWALIGTGSEDHWLMVRRSLQPGEKGDLELAFYRCYSPRPVTLAELTAVAGARWGVEDCFAEAKNEAGLDHYQVRRYRAWYRHITLSMLAHAFLAVTAHAARPAGEAAKPPEQAVASGNTGAQPAKKGTRQLWTASSPRPGHTARRHS
jgi:SRSO17 transposase